ncbi:CPBP family intramembrane glutamic endopeptidase [Pseudolysinimonas kribbensis]|uniref:CPBP family intramembrane glutamic endopeptidase n=1 Tax=Pseudolysinimonas kribbensis TaxID=433641 RepID=UPI0024E132AB|nr:CPBP family intramembrane glutamic endopeptidase [Pseudolysinimonas kribbensis]
MTAPVLSRSDKGRIWWQIVLVLGLGLGQSAIYAIVSLIDYATRPGGLAGQTTTLNPTQSARQYIDLTYQLLDIAFSLAPVVLAGYFVWSSARPHLGRLGVVRPRASDPLWALGLALVIGAGGIGVYVLARQLGFAVGVDASGLAPYWWTVPVLLLSALRSGLQEELVVLGFLYDRLGSLGWNRWAIILTAALVRGSYHLYQGWGGFAGNLVMGLIFGWLYTRVKRVLPFVVAHFLIDAVVFVGYAWAATTFPSLFGVSGH